MRQFGKMNWEIEYTKVAQKLGLNAVMICPSENRAKELSDKHRMVTGFYEKEKLIRVTPRDLPKQEKEK